MPVACASHVPEQVEVAPEPARAGDSPRPLGEHGPVAGQQQVLLQRERRVVLDAPQRDHAVAAAREDVVAHDVLAAVVLIEDLRPGVVADVVLHQEVRAALVQVDAPAAVVGLVNVVDEVAAQDGARLHAERVDAAHVAEHALAEVMDVVAFDAVAARDRVAVAPDPAARDAAVVQVVDVVVRDHVVEAVHDEDAHRAREHAPAGVNGVVGDDVAARAVTRGGIGVPAVDPYPAGAEVGDLVPDDADVEATLAEHDPVQPQVPERAARKPAVPRVFHVDDAGQVARRLRGRAVAVVRFHVVTDLETLQRPGAGLAPVAALEGQVREAHALDRALRRAAQQQELLARGRVDLHLVRGLSRQRQIEQPAA